MRARSAKDILAQRGIPCSHGRRHEAWREAGLPIVGAATGVLPLDRQTQLIAGAMVFTGVLAGLLVSPWAIVRALRRQRCSPA